MNQDSYRVFAMMGFVIIAMLADIAATVHRDASAIGWNMIFIAAIVMAVLFGAKLINKKRKEGGETA